MTVSPSLEVIGWSPASRSRIFSRVTPREHSREENTPCLSGPRWIRVAVAARILSASGVQPFWVKPAMPHKSVTPLALGEEFHQYIVINQVRPASFIALVQSAL